MRQQYSFVRLVLSSVFSFIAAFLLGCGGGHPYTGGSITIYADNASLSAGSSTQLHATQYDLLGLSKDISATVTWASSTPSIAAVSASGLLTGVSAGTTTVTATLSAATGTYGISVGAPTVTSLTLTPANAGLYTNGTQQYTATAAYANNTTANVTSATAWSVLPDSVATISASGLLTAISPGAFVITASIGYKNTTLSGTVSSPPVASIAITPTNPSIQAGTMQQFIATAAYADGSRENVTSSVTWTSSNPSVLTVDAAGLATAHLSNTASTVAVTAQAGGITQTTSVAVTPSATVTALIVQPTSSSIAAGTAEAHTALALYSDGSQNNVTDSVTWSIITEAVAHAKSPTTVATVDQTGMDNAVIPGTATLQASYAGLQSQSTVIVTPATVTGLEITATRDLFSVGAVQQLVLTGTFSDGSRQDLSLTAKWHSSDPAIATIDAKGLATGIAAGNIQFSASFGGLTAATTGFAILPSKLVSTAIEIPYPVAVPGISGQLRLIGIYSDGSSHDLTPLATWSSANPAIFAVDNHGAGYGLNQGETQVTATAFGKSAIANVVTTSSTLTDLQLLPRPAQFALGTTMQFHATGSFNHGANTDVTYATVWRSSDPSVFTVDTHGRVKSGKPGAATLSATLLGVTQTVTVNVSNATLTKLLIAPGTATVTTSTGHPYQAKGFFSDGTMQDLTNDVSWTTTDETIASIDHHGLALGMKLGQVNVNATFATITATSPLTVTDATLVSAAVLPGNTELPLSTNRQYMLVGTFSDGTTEDLNYDAIWSARTPLIVAIFPGGLANGIGAGIGSVSARHGLFGATTPVTVTNATLTGIAITPATATVRRYGQQQFAVTGTFSDGFSQTLLSNALTTTSDPTIAAVDSVGLVTGTGIGTTHINALDNGLTTTGTIQVLSDVLTGIAITPADLALTPGHTQQLTATGTYDDGSTSDLTSQMVWTSSNPTIFSVDPNGLATAYPTTNAVTVSVTATLGTTTRMFTVNVSPASNGEVPTAPTLISVVVTPTSSHIAAGTTQQLTLTGTYSDGTTQNLTSAAVWSSSSVTNAVVTPAGLVTGLLLGSVNITAKLSGMQSTAVVIVTDATLQSVALSPSGASFARGSSQQFTVTGSFTDGTTQNLSAQAVWLSSNPAVATVSATGLVSGTSTGPITLSAAINGQTAFTTAQITPATVVSLIVTPATANFAKGTTQQFTATATYSDNSTHDVTSLANFTTSNPAVIGITSTGLATGMAIGTTQITVTAGGQTATTQSATITPATIAGIAIFPNAVSFANGTNTHFTAIANLSDGTTQDITNQVVWTSSSPAVLTIDASGIAMSGSTGTAQISATLNGTTSSTGTVTVTPAALTSLIVAPASAQVARGTTKQFTATGAYTDGTTQDLSTQVSWTTTNPAAASIDANGLATGVATGTSQINATFQGKSANAASLTVTNAILLLVTFTPSAPSVAAGTSTQVAVIGHFSDGTTQDLTSRATWASSNPAAATVSTTGIVNGIAPGLSLVTVTANGDIAAFPVTVTNATLVSLAITPTTPPSFAKGTTLQFTAIGTYTDGSTQNLSTQVAWTSSNPAVFTIDHNGLATGAGIGTASLTAAFQSQTITTPTIQVTPAMVAAITVLPANQTLTSGTTVQFIATANYTDGTTQDITTQATWTSSNTNAALISSGGLALTEIPGTTTITAQSGDLSGTTTLTTTLAPILVTSLTVTPANAALAAGSAQQYNATAHYSDGSTQDVSATATWTSTVPGAATVSNTGVATGVAAGNTTIAAHFNLITAATPLTITAANATLTSLSITPAAPSLAAGQTQQFTATALYSDSSTQNVTGSVTWHSSTANAAINPAGLATAVSTGASTISAQLNATTVSTTLTISPATLVSIAVTPALANVARGNTQQFAAIAAFSDGSTQIVTDAVTWQSSIPSTASINANGLSTGVNGGATQIWAALSGHTAMATMAVSPATLVALAVTPANVTLANGTSQQYKATGTMTDGSTQDFTLSVIWTSSNASTATINLLGFATSHSLGNTTVTANAGSISASASLGVTAATPTSIQLTPAVILLPAGGTQQLLATATFSDATSQNVTTSVSYLSSTPSVATVDANGKLTATGAGTSSITAALGSVSTTALATITTATLASIAVTPASPSLPAGTSQQLTAIGTYTDGSTQDLTQSVLWTSTAPLTAAVSLTGNVTAFTSGNATINASFLLVNGSTTVTVSSATITSIAVTPAIATLAAGQTQQFTATAALSNLTQQDVTNAVSWSVSNPSKATITGSGGFLTTTAPGIINVTATLNGNSGAALVTIQSALLTSLTITPSPLSLPSGNTQQLAVTGHYTDGSTSDLTASATYLSTNSSAASVNATGMVHAVATGSAFITANVGPVTQTVTTSITNAILSSIAITPSAPSMPAGVQTLFNAIGTYSDGSTQNITAHVQWNSSSSFVATVSTTGLVNSLTVGSSTITATLNGISQVASLTVTAATLQSIAVTATQSTFALGLSLQLTATGTYSDGSTRDLTATTTWSSQSPAIGVVNTSGLVTGVTTGSFNARATTNGITGTLSITVLNAVLQSIVVTPANATLVNLLGTTLQYTATGHFSDGSTQNITTTVHWAISSGLGLGSISSAGNFSPIAIGLGTISATSGTLSGSTGFLVVSVL